jgi:N-acetylmuramoyl-L-alanine amidase
MGLPAVRIAFLGLALAAAAPGATQFGPPTRPGEVREDPAGPPPEIIRVGGVAYVTLGGIAARLGMTADAETSGRTHTLSDPRHQVRFEAESRETLVDGLRLFLGEPAVWRDGALLVSRTDFERRLLPLLRPRLAGPPPRPPRIIAIDPGHGGTDHGTENRRLGLMEKTFTLDVGLRLARMLEHQGYRVVMTRVDDTRLAPDQTTDLQRRAEVANLAGADLFLSIHFNSVAPDTRTRGTEVYVFPPVHQRSSASWQSRQDDSEGEASAANRNDRWNALFAHNLHRELLRELHTEDRGEKLRHLGVLRGLQCPGALAECAFLSNDAEALRVADAAFRQQVAEALDSGIRAYCADLDALRSEESGTKGGPGP